FMQTNLVSPVGAADSCYIIGMVAAKKDFNLRLMRDSPDIGQSSILPEQVATTQIESVVRTVANTVESEIRAELGVIPSLNAAETGATSNTEPEEAIQTRTVINMHGTAECLVENFLGRAALVCMQSIEYKNHTTSGANSQDNFFTWTINTREFVQIRRKMELFTYLRFDTEITIIPTLRLYSSANVSYAGLPNLTLQAMYVPTGAPKPKKQDSYEWQSSCNPSIFFKIDDPPARITIPFMRTPPHIKKIYDGFAGFEKRAADLYGINPANTMGNLCLRVVNSYQPAQYTLTVRVYMKPKHIKAWAPRPPRTMPYTNIANNNYVGQTSAPNSVTAIVSNRQSVTTMPNDINLSTTGPGYGGVFVCSYKVINYHLATDEERERAVYVDWQSDILVTTVAAHGKHQIARCKCNTGVYYCRHKDRSYPVCFEGPG
ncbi:VP1, partial [enterovirus D120]